MESIENDDVKMIDILMQFMGESCFIQIPYKILDRTSFECATDSSDTIFIYLWFYRYSYERQWMFGV